MIRYIYVRSKAERDGQLSLVKRMAQKRKNKEKLKTETE